MARRRAVTREELAVLGVVAVVTLFAVRVLALGLLGSALVVLVVVGLAAAVLIASRRR
jgi:hypothetical protein